VHVKIYEQLVQSKLSGWWRLMTLHHGLTLILLGSVLHTGHLHYYGCWVGTVEGTNPCLSMLLTIRRIGRKESEWCVQRLWLLARF